MKNFYVIRDCPYPAPITGDVIGYDRATALTWDIIYIMQANGKFVQDELPAQCLHKQPDGSVIYFERTDYHTFNMLDAFGIPHMDNDSTKFTIITPQVVGNKDGTKSVTVSAKNNKPLPLGQYIKMLRK